jgi:hypothetical protein
MLRDQNRIVFTPGLFNMRRHQHYHYHCCYYLFRERLGFNLLLQVVVGIFGIILHVLNYLSRDYFLNFDHLMVPYVLLAFFILFIVAL